MTDTAQGLERPDWACLLCAPPRTIGAWRKADPNYRTCSGCLDRLRDNVQDVVRRYLMLNPRPGATGEHGGRGAPGFGSRSPASDHIIAMRDRRSSATARTWRGRDGRLHMESERPPLSVHSVLDTLAWTVAEERGVDGPSPTSDVHELGRWLDRHLDWITRHDVVVEVDRAVREILGQLKPLTGDPGRRQIGVCPVVIDEGESTRTCGARLYAPLRGDEIECGTCGERWPRETWLRLGNLLESA